jgi:carbamoyl-phosphate synthase large subunit
LPQKGTVSISVNDHHKTEAVQVARRFLDLGFQIVATRGTAAALRNAGLPCKTVFKVNEGRPNAVDLLKGGDGERPVCWHGRAERRAMSACIR